MSLFFESAQEFTWIIHVFALLLFLHWLKKLFHTGFGEIFTTTVSELVDLLKRDLSMGAWNMMAIIAGAAIATLSIAAIEIEKILQVIVATLGRRTAETFIKHASFATMFYVLMLLLIVSVIFVFLDKWRRH